MPKNQYQPANDLIIRPGENITAIYAAHSAKLITIAQNFLHGYLELLHDSHIAVMYAP
jgi:hypothetical protein